MLEILNVSAYAPEQLKQFMVKPAFDKVELGEGAKKRIAQTFGREMSAAEVVDQIVNDIRQQGDKALFHYSQLIDGVTLTEANFEVSAAEIESALDQIDPAVLAALQQAERNVRAFHEEQLPKSWITYREEGSMLGQNVRPLERVGIYVPGGTASYPSSVIMNAVPASVAGVKEIIMVVPPAKDGSVNPCVLAAAKLAGVHRIFRIGGAQAIAGLAFGSELMPKVDKITGPGNIFVTLAKKAVYGHCDIDMLAGPSEILILADEQANPVYAAADMLSQAEHDPLAACMVVTNSPNLAQAIQVEVKKQLELLPRREIAAASLANNGKILVAKDMLQAAEIANYAAPEHLEVLAENPFSLLPYLEHAGAIFLGPYSPEPLGDYMAGPNHVLPTGGTARFYSVLNVDTFMKKTSIISYTKAGLEKVSDAVICLAEAEGLTAHANAIRKRGMK
ncbi:MAG: histidinol dehydrogenase [Sporomusaceae bacterium]|nr:histidinol dehydrogenase [Sporomusaceae bacterium]